MGRKSAEPAAQSKTRTSGSGSSKSLASTSGNTPKPPPSKKPRATEPDEEKVGRPSVALPQKRKNATIALTADKPKPLASKKDVRPKSKPVKSPLTAANAGRKSDPNPAGKRKKVIPEPVEADSEESEQEWVGFGDVEDEGEEDEDEDEGGDDSDSSEEELLHGLSSDDQDSSDEEVELPGIDVSKLPTIAKDDKIVKQKLEKAKRQPVRIAFARSSTLLLNSGFGID
jgi:nucleolar protein 15